MVNKDYIFHSTFYDKELLNKIVIFLDDNKINYQLVNIENHTQARAPLSGYFENELYIHKADYEKVDRMLKQVLEK